jgi:hypothetical protein
MRVGVLIDSIEPRGPGTGGAGTGGIARRPGGDDGLDARGVHGAGAGGGTGGIDPGRAGAAADVGSGGGTDGIDDGRGAGLGNTAPLVRNGDFAGAGGGKDF